MPRKPLPLSTDPNAGLEQEFGNLASAITAMSREMQEAVTKALREELKRMADEGFMLKPNAPEGASDIAPARSLNEGNFELVRYGLQELVERIEMTREHVSALTPAVNESYKIFNATSELRSIVDATEQATQNILESAEAIQDLLEQAVMDDRADIDLSQRLGEQVTLIITSCSFQDLTGQRISATVNTLEHTEDELRRLVELWDLETEGTATSSNLRNRPGDTREDKHLLHGPQADGGASQEDIDSLLKKK